MNILDTIISAKKKEVAISKAHTRTSDLERSVFFQRPTLSLKQFILDPQRSGIIAEYKRRSPSKGIINDKSTVEDVTKAYAEGGASALSVLTDKEFFGGSATDLEKARINMVPILRKDFIIDEYQVVEARAMGADLILLIAACLSPAELRNLALCAKSLELEVLLELHDDNELEHINEYTEMIGINNRNLKTFEVDMEKSIRMAERIGDAKIRIAESGIRNPEDILKFRGYGFDGFLIGENFMKENDPGAAFRAFVKKIKSLA